MKEKSISVVTVCYNAGEDLKKTLNSVLAQDYKDMEYIVVDGGSTDGSIEMLKRYEELFAQTGRNFRYISEEDKGTYDAMNKGARMANCEWINYMNAGDAFYENTTLSDFFANEIPDSVGVVYGDTYQVYDFGIGIATEEDFKRDNTVMPFCHQSSFVRTNLVRGGQFNISYKIIADNDFFLRMREKGVEFLYIPIVVSRYNGQYGLSATHPLTLRRELLRAHHIDKHWYYPFALMWAYMRYGWVQPFKDHMPRWMTDAWMKHKRKYIESHKYAS